MKNLVICNARVIDGDSVSQPMSVLCGDGRIIAVGGSAPDAQVLDAGGRYLAPGYIDLHIHGVQGHMADKGRGPLEAICRVLPQYGVTGFLPTLTPIGDDIALLRDLAGVDKGGSKVLGFFLEGHYLKLTGAIRNIPGDYTLERLQALKRAAGSYRLVFGVSPEIDELAALYPEMTVDGYPAFITHTGADAAQTAAAIGQGARHATHFYDVFPYPGDREPGVRGCGAVEAVLADPRVTVDFILDGEHVDPVAVKMALACKGPGGVCLITDANVNAGLPPGRYQGIGGDEVTVAYPGAPARMSDDARQPGSLVGSGLTMDQAVRNAVQLLEVTLPQAVRMASGNPAAVLGLQDRKGRIAPGYDADFSLLDNHLQVEACYVAGECVFERITEQ